MKKISLITLLCLTPLHAISEDFINDILSKQNEQEALETTRGLFNSQNRFSVSGGEIREHVIKFVDKHLKSQVATLPPDVQKEFAAAIESIAKALSQEASKRKYNALNKEYVDNALHAAFKKFFTSSDSYVDQANIVDRIDHCVNHHLKKAGINIGHENQAFRDEFLSRKVAVATALRKLMESQQRTYVTKQEIESVFHNVFEGFIKRVQGHVKWQFAQSRIDDFKKVMSKDKAVTYIPESGASKLLHDHLKQSTTKESNDSRSKGW